jgi:hypothetical protein
MVVVVVVVAVVLEVDSQARVPSSSTKLPSKLSVKVISKCMVFRN